MKKIKRIISNVFIFTMVTLTIMTSVGMAAKANDTAQSFDYSFTHEGNWDITDLVEKNTPSSITMQCTWAEYKESYYGAWILDEEGNELYPGTYTFWEGTWRAMPNYIYESGHTGACVKAFLVDDGGSGNGASFSGYWYADSGIY